MNQPIGDRPPLQLPKVDNLHGRDYQLHNHYALNRFYDEKTLGEYVTKYQQRAMFVTEDFIVAFQGALEKEVGDAASEIMYRCGYEWGKQDMAHFVEHFQDEFHSHIHERPLRFVLETWWWPFQAAGWGSWGYDMGRRDEGLIFVDIFNSAVAQSIGNVGHVVCHYYAGMFAAVFGHLAKHDLSGIEIQCYSLGEEWCKFLVGSSKRVNAANFWVQEGIPTKTILERL